MSADARIIYQRLLSHMTGAITEHDSDAWVAGMALPHQMSTAEGKLVLETVRDVQIGFTDYVSALARIGVARVERSCCVARLVAPGKISGYHSTVMFRDDGEALPEYFVSWTLHQGTDDIWRVMISEAALSVDQWADLPHNDLSQFQREDTNSEMRLRRMVQAFFHQADTTLLHGEFGEWTRFYQLPMVVEFDRDQNIIHTTEDLRRDFEFYRDRFVAGGVTDITRVVRTAERVGDALLIATYRAHVLSDADYIVDPWNGAATMRWENGRWRIVGILNALPFADWQPASGPGAQTSKENRVSQGNLTPVTETPTSGRN